MPPVIEHQDNGKISSPNPRGKPYTRIDFVSYGLLALLIAITIFAYPETSWNSATTVSIHHVFYYGWITAISTGLGVLPFYFITEPNKFYMGISNAIAGGMMIAASASLSYEGFIFFEGTERAYNIHPGIRTALGFLAGVGFIIITKRFLDKHEDLKLGDGIDGSNAQKMVLIVFVMTLHSLTEGIGIGVSFGGKTGMKLGQFISLSLAVHNIPEGLAVALVLTSRKISKIRAGLWAVFTSLPQPLMAIPAFVFVENFIPMLPTGLGFASGAMAFVAVFELFVEAIEDTNVVVATVVGATAFVAMMVAQEFVKNLG